MGNLKKKCRDDLVQWNEQACHTPCSLDKHFPLFILCILLLASWTRRSTASCPSILDRISFLADIYCIANPLGRKEINQTSWDVLSLQPNHSFISARTAKPVGYFSLVFDLNHWFLSNLLTHLLTFAIHWELCFARHRK